MPQGYDGDIKLSVSLSADDVKSSAQSLSNEIKGIFDKSAGKELDSKFQKLQGAMSKAVTKSQELQSAMKRLEDTNVPTEEYREIQTQIDKARDSLVKLLDRQQKFIETGGDIGSKAYKGMQYDVDELRNTIAYAEGELQELVDTGKAFTLGSETDQYANLKNQLNDTNNQMRVLATSAEQYTSKVDKASTTTNRFSNLLKSTKSIFGHIGNGIKSLGNGLKSLAQRFIHAGRSASSFGSKLNFKNILGYAIGIRSLFSLFSKLRSAIASGISDMAKLNGGMNQTNVAMSQLQASLNYLRGSLAAAFTPILTVVSPILSNFIDQIASVINAIGMMIAKLTGAKSYFRATKTSANYAGGSGGSSGKSAEEKYNEAVEKAQAKYEKELASVREKNAKAQAKAEEQQAKAAERLAKQQEKANKQLAAFDDLNVLNIEDLEELEEIEADVYDEPELELPDKEDFQDAIGGGSSDPFGLEEVALDDVEWDWSKIKKLAEELGRTWADALNDVFADEQLAANIGYHIAEALNTALHLAYGFIDELNWHQMGRWLGTLIQEGLETFEWDLLGETIGEFLNGLADSIIGFFETYEVGTLGDSIATMLNNAIKTIDPNKLGEAVANMLKAPLIELSHFFTATNWTEMGTKVSQFLNKVFTSDSLNGETLGTTIGNCLRDGFNAAVDFLQNVHLDELIVKFVVFFEDLFTGGIEGVNWADVFDVIEDVIDGLITAIIIVIEDGINSLAEALDLEPIFPEDDLELMKQGYLTFFDSLSASTEDYKKILKSLSPDIQLSINDLYNLQQQYGFTDEQMDKLIRRYKELNPALDESANGFKEYAGDWSETAKEIEEASLKVTNVTNEMNAGITNDLKGTENAVVKFGETHKDVMKQVEEAMNLEGVNESFRPLLEAYYEGTLSAEDFAHAVNEMNGVMEGLPAAVTAQDVITKFGEAVVDVTTKVEDLGTTADTSLNNLPNLISGYTDQLMDSVKASENLTETVTEGSYEMEEAYGGVEEAVGDVKSGILTANGEIDASIDTSKANVEDYSSSAVSALAEIDAKTGEIKINFEAMTEMLQLQLDNLTLMVDEWYQNLIATYFGYDAWALMLTEGIMLALTDFFLLLFTTWDENMLLWWEEHVVIWFTPDKWDAEIFAPFMEMLNQKWANFLDWWETNIKTWYDDLKKKWNKFLENVKQAWEKFNKQLTEHFAKTKEITDEVWTEIQEIITEKIDGAKEAVLAACDEMRAAIEEIIGMMGELQSFGGGIGGSTAGGASFGGSSSGGGGGPRGFMPMLDIMHFEDNLGMSAFKFPELATGAVIPPNDKFLAILGDQRNGVNIETPLATMLQAFRTVMEEYYGRGQSATMELDGETFARLMLPHVMNEMQRVGYNTEIIEGT